MTRQTSRPRLPAQTRREGRREARPPELGPGEVDVALTVDGTARTVRVEPRVSLLDALRERMGVTGPKKGCDQGACGACTVMVDGRRVLACLTLAVTCEGREITTVEGLADGDRLHPVQEAFIANDAFQCGYCTPGQLVSAVALLEEGHTGDDAEIAEWMSGNICRCAAYPNIRAAIRQVRDRREGHATDTVGTVGAAGTAETAGPDGAASGAAHARGFTADPGPDSVGPADPAHAADPAGAHGSDRPHTEGER